MLDREFPRTCLGLQARNTDISGACWWSIIAAIALGGLSLVACSSTGGSAAKDAGGGTTGSAGAGGTAGSVGQTSAGGTGGSGTAGSAGTSGAAGADAAAGAGGVAGSTGTSGVAGADATAGIDGAAGTGGKSGADAAAGAAGATGTGGAAGGSGGISSIWRPALDTSWQWQLTGAIDTSVAVQMFDVDLFDVDASVVKALHDKGARVVCYMSAGSYENWRPDQASFPASVLGQSNGWPGEKWLDVRQLDVLEPIMKARLDLCVSKGFDGVEFDNVDGYTNSTGFPLTAADQLTYDRFLAGQAHARGLSAALKNDLDQIPDLLGDFDWALNEQCFEYDECDALKAFVSAGKAVFNVEYNLETSGFCPEANTLNFNSMKKNLALDVPRWPCR